jgi:hypothetical protein
MSTTRMKERMSKQVLIIQSFQVEESRSEECHADIGQGTSLRRLRISNRFCEYALRVYTARYAQSSTLLCFTTGTQSSTEPVGH